MNEQKKEVKEEKPEETTEQPSEGDKPKELTPIEAATKERERLETATENARKENQRTEELEANRILGGQSSGREQEKPKLNDEQKASRERIKAIGRATGAKWAEDMDKEDGN